jgi:hypothetical protein
VCGFPRGKRDLVSFTLHAPAAVSLRLHANPTELHTLDVVVRRFPLQGGGRAAHA